MNNSGKFNEHDVLHKLKHYLPAQAPLKDFVHHNTLHAFQDQKFEDALRNASSIFGYKVSLTIEEYRELFATNRIRKDILDHIITKRNGKKNHNDWLDKLLHKKYDSSISRKIGTLRSNWKSEFHIDLDAMVHVNLFRILNSYLDQGIAIWSFPIVNKGLLSSVKELEKNSYASFFQTGRAKNLLFNAHTTLAGLLKILVGKEDLFEQYLFDQQFSHSGWSGLVHVIEDLPESLLDYRKISLKELIFLELLLEIDALDAQFGTHWQPLGYSLKDHVQPDLFAENPHTEKNEVQAIWQEAFEWSYYDEVLAGIKSQNVEEFDIANPSFQAFFCIDDRECSIRRYLEAFDPDCETYGTPGHYNIATYYQPEHGKFHTKICPAPVTPNHLIKEESSKRKQEKDFHFHKHTHSLFGGWLITHTIGFWSAFVLFINIFRPRFNLPSTNSFRHMEKFSSLTIENKNPEHKKDNLQIGFTIDEMVNIVEGVLKSTGLTKNFAPLIYIIGHGSSSSNNTHYAGYDCGACSGRPGSANAKAFSYMANHKNVREKLIDKGIAVPDQTQFLGGLHDTTRDEFMFYGEGELSASNLEAHQKNKLLFDKALAINAKERSRRFKSVNSKQTAKEVHEEVKKRSVALFEPRPELNHATNALCIIGRRWLTHHLFLDRRSFLNSYDYRLDPTGRFLENILNAATPVCGGINLEYYFSRVDAQKLGAGSKLPHNVMGLIAVANGVEGDLRPGLPYQMVEVHDPIRLLIVVEHFPEVLLKTIQSNPDTYEWILNEWVNLVAVHPETREFFTFKDGFWNDYQPLKKKTECIPDLNTLIESHEENFNVYQVK